MSSDAPPPTSPSPKGLPLSQVRWLVVHCSDSPYGNAQIIDRWHRQRGFSEIGYHFVILNPYPDEHSWRHHRPRFESDGVVEKGRPLTLAGAHLQGRNLHSIGICLIGKDLFTSAQFFSLTRLLAQLKEKFPPAEVVGHYELLLPHQTPKTCPNIDMDYLRTLLSS